MAKLRPRARIIRTIGDQLISGPEAALIELVKNAYDADSPNVRIKIVPKSTKSPLGAITVSDQGHGMSMDVITNTWFEPATDDKLRKKYSPGGRRMLGAKGIGRFAAARLGNKTTVRSISFESLDARSSSAKPKEVTVQINWNDFAAEKYLDDVDIPVSTRNLVTSSKIKSGVTLHIAELRDAWTEARVVNLIKELRRMVTPMDAGDAFKIHLDLSEFTKETAGFDGLELLKKQNVDFTSELEANDSDLIVPFKLQEHGDYLLAGSFDGLGEFKGTFTICKGDNKPELLTVLAPALRPDDEACGPIELRINIYDREAESIEALFGRLGLNFEKIGIRSARQILTDNAGLAIFRNGFRIRPYGEPEHDWLELERQRVQDPSKKLGLSQISGRVEIEDEETSGLIERSSREGLEHNGEFDRLKRLIHGVLLHVEERRVSFREKAGLSRKKTGDVGKAKEAATLRHANSAVSKLPKQFRDSIKKAITKDAEALALSLEEIDEYQKLLQSRAALGLVVAQVIHEGRRILNPMATSAKSLFERKHLVLSNSKQGEVFRKQFPDHASVIFDGTKSMSRLFKQLDPVSGRRRGRPAAFQIQKVVEACIALFSEALNEGVISVHIDLQSPLKVYGYVEDFQAALLNILENAIYWLGVSSQDSKNIYINGAVEKKIINITVENDGPLIDDRYVERLFQPGFSLKAEGTGLGLSIAREACRASKGDLLLHDGADHTKFTIQFPAAAE